MANKTRTFGGKDDVNFWADKPVQRGHPKFKEKWYHIHRYNITKNVVMKSPCGNYTETMPWTVKKCRCGKTKV
jgi:hypothetical protein